MRRFLPFLVPIVLFGLMDVINIRSLLLVSETFSIITTFYIGLSVLGYVGMILALRYWSINPIKRTPLLHFLIGSSFAVMVSKLMLFVLVTFYNLIRVVGSLEISSLVLVGMFAFSLIPFVAMLYGITWGKYRFKLENTTLVFTALPKAFDGFKILQISDVHAGSWDSLGGVEKGIHLIEAQSPDLIVFTGDLVNASKEEINPYMYLFERLKAPYGKYAILGNHDYYGQPRARELRSAYYDDFFSKFEKMGFDLIRNDSREIKIGQDIIKLIGVENWGSGRYFPKRGDLDIATRTCYPEDFCILLSHDPSHWDLKCLDHPQHFHLTLSGHTHGGQFGINLPFFKWSPVQYRYKRWMGLYKESEQYLYVNRGFGLLAYPGRVGMSPEVTVITLKKSILDKTPANAH